MDDAKGHPSILLREIDLSEILSALMLSNTDQASVSKYVAIVG